MRMLVIDFDYLGSLKFTHMTCFDASNILTTVSCTFLIFSVLQIRASAVSAWPQGVRVGPGPQSGRLRVLLGGSGPQCARLGARRGPGVCGGGAGARVGGAGGQVRRERAQRRLRGHDKRSAGREQQRVGILRRGPEDRRERQGRRDAHGGAGPGRGRARRHLRARLGDAGRGPCGGDCSCVLLLRVCRQGEGEPAQEAAQQQPSAAGPVPV